MIEPVPARRWPRLILLALGLSLVAIVALVVAPSAGAMDINCGGG